jgi:pimeloyl-ACP methyl ester carboxylesterase
MAEYLLILQREAAAILAVAPAPEIPVIVISSGHQTAVEVAAHRALAAASPQGRHLVAAKSGHWIQFDQPEVIVDAVRSLVQEWRARHPLVIEDR